MHILIRTRHNGMALCVFSVATTMQAYCTGTGKSARNALKIHRRERKSELKCGRGIARRRESKRLRISRPRAEVPGDVRFLVHFVRRDALTRGMRVENKSGKKKFQRMTEMLTNNKRGF